MHRYWLIFDLETDKDSAALDLLEPPEPDRRLTDPAKVEKDIQAKLQAQYERCSLDPYAGRIISVGMSTELQPEPQVATCRTEDDERKALAAFLMAASSRHVIGYCCLPFDLPWVLTRARLLGLSVPDIDLRKYGNRQVTDLYDLLTFYGAIPEPAMRRTLKNFCRRFGIPVDDATAGADIPRLVQAGDWEAVAAHNRSDVWLTMRLAERLGLITVTQEQEAF